MRLHLQGEHGGIVSAWILKLLIWLALAGVLLFEAGSVVVATLGADDAARGAAQESVATYAGSRNLASAKRAAEARAGVAGADLIDFEAAADGVGGQSRVTLTVQKTAKTIFLHRVGFLKRFTKTKVSATAYST